MVFLDDLESLCSYINQAEAQREYSYKQTGYLGEINIFKEHIQCQ